MEQSRFKCPFCEGLLKDLEETGYVIHMHDKNGERVQDDEWDVAQFK